MSVSASIDVVPTLPAQARASFALPLLFAAGWRTHLPGYYEHLPEGDDDEYAWQVAPMHRQELLELVARKEANDETVGVLLTWKTSGSGGSFLFDHDRIMLSITFKRRTNPVTGITDLAWYADRLLPALAGSELAAVILSHVR